MATFETWCLDITDEYGARFPMALPKDTTRDEAEAVATTVRELGATVHKIFRGIASSSQGDVWEDSREPSAAQERAWDEQYDGTSLGA